MIDDCVMFFCRHPGLLSWTSLRMVRLNIKGLVSDLKKKKGLLMFSRNSATLVLRLCVVLQLNNIQIDDALPDMACEQQ